MGSRIFTLAVTMALAGTVSAASAQTPEPMTKAQVAVACAPPPVVMTAPADAPRIMGSQDVVQRGTFGTLELLVLNAGSARGIQLNQQYFVRRLYRTAETYRDKLPHTVQTAGWVHVIAVNATMSIVTPDHTCSDLREGDFLEPFAAPAVTDDIYTPVLQGELDFKNYARVLHSENQKSTAGTGEFIFIDHGGDRNISIGSHFGIWRDLQENGVPLTSIGEATAVAVSPSMALLLVTRARDAVFINDIIVPRLGAGVTGAPISPGSPAASAAPNSADVDAMFAKALRQLSEYKALMDGDAPVDASDRLQAARQTLEQLQKFSPTPLYDRDAGRAPQRNRRRED
jgi:hypothetical protein